MKKIKAIHIITRLDAGGSAENTFLTAREFLRRGWETQIWAGRGYDLPREIEKEAQKEGLPIVWFPSLVRSIHPLKDAAALFALWRALRREKPDLVHTHTSKAGFLGRLAARLAGVRAVAHTPHGHVFYGYFGPLKTRLFIRLERLAARWTDRIIPLTPRGAEEHLQAGIGKKEQYAPVASGIDFSKLAPSAPLRKGMRKSFSLPETVPVVGAIGRFVPIKGFDLIVEAAPLVLQKIPSAVFYLGGTGPLKEKLERRVAELKLERHFIFDDFQEVERPLQLMDVFLLPSRNEGQSRTLVEAMYFKKGIVAASVGGVPDVIRHGKTGLLVEPDDPRAFARAVVELLGKPEKLRALGEAAGEEARRRFSLSAMINRLEEVYEEILR